MTHHGTTTLQLDVTQRTDTLDTASGVQCGNDGPQAADGIGAGDLRLAQYKHPDGASITHRNTGLHADHLARYALLQVLLDAGEALAGDVDGSEFRKTHPTVAIHH